MNTSMSTPISKIQRDKLTEFFSVGYRDIAAMINEGEHERAGILAKTLAQVVAHTSGDVIQWPVILQHLVPYNQTYSQAGGYTDFMSELDSIRQL